LNRREGLLKKARELATLCGVDVTLIMFTPRGELCEFSSNTKAHVLYQYLKKREQEPHTDPRLVALYYTLAHVEALEHEANRYKYNLELHRTRIDPRLRKFTANELQIMNEHNLLNKFKETLQHNQQAILELHEKWKEVGVFDTPMNREKVGGNFLIHPEDFSQNYQAPQVPQETYNHHRTSRYVNDATPLTMDEQQDPQWDVAAPGPLEYVANQGQYQQSQHQVHTRHHEAYNMPQQSMMQQSREYELLMATMERERELSDVEDYHKEILLSHPDRAEDNDLLGEQDLADLLQFISKEQESTEEQGNHQQEAPTQSNDGNEEVGASNMSLPRKVDTRL
jgi:hypothetical protein